MRIDRTGHDVDDLLQTDGPIPDERDEFVAVALALGSRVEMEEAIGPHVSPGGPPAETTKRTDPRRFSRASSSSPVRRSTSA